MDTNLLLIILGTILVVEGMPYFLFPQRVKRFYEQIRGTENAVLRIAGLVLILLGMVIVYLVKDKVCN